MTDHVAFDPVDPADLVLARRGERAAISMFSFDGIGQAVEANAFTQEELVSGMIDRIRSPKAEIAHAAAALFTKYTREVLELSGRIGKATITRKENDNQQTISTQSIIPSFDADSLAVAGKTFIPPLSHPPLSGGPPEGLPASPGAPLSPGHCPPGLSPLPGPGNPGPLPVV